MAFRSVTVIGLGYIGLPTAAMFASQGVKVVGVDVSEHAIEAINDGRVHIVEPGLDVMVESAVNAGNLVATDKPRSADAFVIAVPTPFKDQQTGTPEPDISFIKAACIELAPVLTKGNLIVLESTSPIGTTEKICEWLSELRPDLNFPMEGSSDADLFVAHCPERVLPGKVIHELVHNDRIIGGITPKCSKAAVDLYKLFVKAECFVTNSRTAEMAKLTENASRDVQIAFANELSVICDEQNINVWELIELANKHPRVSILQPGPGVGGHCIAVDPWFLVHSNPQSAKLINLARNINDSKPEWVISKIRKEVEAIQKLADAKADIDVKIAFYGMSFKPDIDDFRESPALKVIEGIRSTHIGEIIVVEPNLPDNYSCDFRVVRELPEGCRPDIHVMLVDHVEFKRQSVPTSGALIDTRGIWTK